MPAAARESAGQFSGKTAARGTQAMTSPYSLSAAERDRYDRQLIIPEIGPIGQEKLKRAKVLVCGVGGLGSPAATCLAAAGVGTVTLVDPDRVGLSNLNRQVLHWESDIGRKKVASARYKLNRLNDRVTIVGQPVRITAANVAGLVAGQDVIIDALDNMDSRYLLNQAALEQQIAFIHGAVSGFEGRLMTVLPGRSTCLRCLHRGPMAPTEKIPVIGVAPAVIGALQATEAIKVILDIGELATNRLVTFDGLSLRWRDFTVTRNPACDHCGSSQERNPE